MLQNRNSVNEIKFNRICKTVNLMNMSEDVFLENIVTRVLFENTPRDVSSFFTEVEKSLSRLDEKWWNPASWFSGAEKKPAKSTFVPDTEKRHKDVDYTPEKLAAFDARDERLRKAAERNKALELVGGTSGIEKIKNRMKEFLTAGTNSPEGFVRKMKLTDMNDHQVRAIYLITKQILNFLDNYDLKLKIVRDTKDAEDILKHVSGLRTPETPEVPATAPAPAPAAKIKLKPEDEVLRKIVKRNSSIDEYLATRTPFLTGADQVQQLRKDKISPYISRLNADKAKLQSLGASSELIDSIDNVLTDLRDRLRNKTV